MCRREGRPLGSLIKLNQYPLFFYLRLVSSVIITGRFYGFPIDRLWCLIGTDYFSVIFFTSRGAVFSPLGCVLVFL